jgi:hypothetical protein
MNKCDQTDSISPPFSAQASTVRLCSHIFLDGAPHLCPRDTPLRIWLVEESFWLRQRGVRIEKNAMLDGLPLYRRF